MSIDKKYLLPFLIIAVFSLIIIPIPILAEDTDYTDLSGTQEAPSNYIMDISKIKTNKTVTNQLQYIMVFHYDMVNSLNACTDLQFLIFPYVYVDIDNDRFTGSDQTYTPWEWGAEYGYKLTSYYYSSCSCQGGQQSTCHMDASTSYNQFVKYNTTTGSWDYYDYGTQGYPGGGYQWLNKNLTLTMPLSSINAGVGKTFTVRGGIETTVVDTVGPYGQPHIKRNVTVQYGQITVDGDASDWSQLNPVETDDPDGLNSCGLNKFSDAKKFYMSSDDQYMYFMYEMYGEMPEWNVMIDYSVQLDYDNDGAADVDLLFKDDFARYLNMHNPNDWHYLYKSTGDYDVVYKGGKYVEIKVNLTGINAPTPIVGSKVTVMHIKAQTTIRDDAPDLVYKVGGGILRGANKIWQTEIDNMFNPIDYLPKTIDYKRNGETFLTLKVNGTRTSYLMLQLYDKDPNGASNAPVKFMDGYLSVFVNDVNQLNWPLVIQFHYDPQKLAQAGLDESTLQVLFYDSNSNSYTAIGSYTVDRQTHIVTVQFTKQDYLAGDDPTIVVTDGGSTGGGNQGNQGGQQNNNPPQSQPIELTPEKRMLENISASFFKYREIADEASFLENMKDIKNLAERMIANGLMDPPPRISEENKQKLRELLELVFGPYMVDYPDPDGRLFLLYWLYF